MRVVIQRVKQASVEIDQKIKSKIDSGLMILLGVEDLDTKEDIEWLCKKILNLRIFADENGVMNRSVMDVDGELMVVSQFTLHANTKKGNRPSYIRAAKPEVSIPMYEAFVEKLKDMSNKDIATGEFGANMQVGLINDGPVTIIMDSKNRDF